MMEIGRLISKLIKMIKDRMISLTYIHPLHIGLISFILAVAVKIDETILLPIVGIIIMLCVIDSLYPLHRKLDPYPQGTKAIYPTNKYIISQNNDVMAMSMAGDSDGNKPQQKSVPSPFPNGWFMLAYSFELQDEEVKYVKALGKQFAIWRDTKDPAKVHVFDSICPHLGANMAIGGTVDRENNLLRCPFHGWGFDKDGNLADIYGLPQSSCASLSQAKVHSYPAVERNQMILVWIASEQFKDTPFYEVPLEPCFTQQNEYESYLSQYLSTESTFPKPGAWCFNHPNSMVFTGIVDHVVRCHIQEIPENGADGAHLFTVHAPFVIAWLSGWIDHAWNFKWIQGTKEKEDFHKAVVLMDLGTTVLGNKVKAFDIAVHTTQVGPSLVHEYLTLPFGLGTVYFASSVTPVRPLEQRYTHSMWAPWWIPRFIPKLLLRGLAIQVERDIPIWNFKSFQARPPYSKLDSNIPKFRKWYSQFYSEDSIELEQALESERCKFFEW